MFAKFLDPYERKARLYPALLVAMPVLASFIAELASFEKKLPALIGLAGAFGGFYLLSSVVRDYGKRLEIRMLKEWGAMPTTQLLRHRDLGIDKVTKARYHAFLSKQIGINFPTRDEENSDPEHADSVYQSAVRWLLEKTRDTKQFSLIFKENVAYGFRRNGMAVRRAGMCVCALTVVYLAASVGVFGIWYIDPRVLTGIDVGHAIAFLLCFALLAVWPLFFNKETLRISANTYARALLAACDVLPKKR